MKKISLAVLVSMFAAGAASAQGLNSGIVATHDANVVSQIEQHAQEAQPQRPAVEQDAQAVHMSPMHKTAEHHHHHHYHHHVNHMKDTMQP